MRNKKSTLLYRWFEEVWNNNQEDSIEQLMTADSHAHGLAAELPKGAPGFRIFYNGFKDQFENIHIDLIDVVSQDDMESGLTEVTARHKGTGKNVKFTGLCMVRIEDGKIAEAWNQYDFMNMNQQLQQEAPTPEIA